MVIFGMTAKKIVRTLSQLNSKAQDSRSKDLRIQLISALSVPEHTTDSIPDK